MPLAHRRLCLLFTPELCARQPWDTLRAALRGGVDLVQWRVKTPDPEGLQQCLQACRRAHVPMIVNDDVMAAVRARAAGAHVGQDDMTAGAARRVLEKLWLGVSTHDEGQIDAAIAAGADYLGFGPCFPTSTKGYAQGQPPDAIAAAVRRSRVPVFAIGGITPDNVRGLLRLGVRHVAVSAAILGASDPEAAAAALATPLAKLPR